MDQNRLDELLALVIAQARSIGIPVSDRIHPRVVINRRAKTRFGCCRTLNGIHTIELSAVLLAAPKEVILGVLAHEILHTCPGCANHGIHWRGNAARMSARFGYFIRRTDSYDHMGLDDLRPIRYLLVCEKCGKTIPRMKRSSLVAHPERYRCTCGGRLRLTDPAE